MLEQLIQSQSFAGSIEAAYGLRDLSVASFAITLLWALSPIGGQSSLRVLSTAAANIQSETSVYGVTAETMRYFGGSAHQVNDQNVINALFSASLLAPDSTRSGPTDTWANIKIPASKYVLDLQPNAWRTFDTASGSINYSSLVGVPTWCVPDQGTASFNLNWPIVDTDCHWEQPGYSELEWCKFCNNHPDPNNALCETYNTAQQCILNETTGEVQGQTSDGGLSVITSNVPYNLTQLYSNSTPQYMDILFSVRNSHKVNNISYPGSKSRCRLRTVRVEAGVLCNDGACHVSKVRKSNDPRPDFINPVSAFPFTTSQIMISLAILHSHYLFGLLPFYLPYIRNATNLDADSGTMPQSILKIRSGSCNYLVPCLTGYHKQQALLSISMLRRSMPF